MQDQKPEHSTQGSAQSVCSHGRHTVPLSLCSATAGPDALAIDRIAEAAGLQLGWMRGLSPSPVFADVGKPHTRLSGHGALPMGPALADPPHPDAISQGKSHAAVPGHGKCPSAQTLMPTEAAGVPWDRVGMLCCFPVVVPTAQPPLSLHSKALCGFVFLTVLQLLLNLLKSYHPCSINRSSLKGSRCHRLQCSWVTAVLSRGSSVPLPTRSPVSAQPVLSPCCLPPALGEVGTGLQHFPRASRSMVRLAAWTPWGKNEPFSHFCNISLSQCTLRLGVTDLGLTGLALSRSLFPLSEMPAVHLLLQHGDTAPFPCSLEALLPDPSAAVETGSPLPALPQAAAAQSHRLPTGQICTQHLLISSLGPSLQLLSLDHCNQRASR